LSRLARLSNGKLFSFYPHLDRHYRRRGIYFFLSLFGNIRLQNVAANCDYALSRRVAGHVKLRQVVFEASE
jgi:hypothetical protein